jgi:lipopolysaccharide export system protein LptA
MRRISFIALAVLLPLAFGAAAEKADREKKIVLNADRIVADDAKKTSVSEGNVIVTQGTMRMTADKVTVSEDAEKHKYYVATGSPVTFKQKLDNSEEWVEGFAQRAEFDDLNDVLRLYEKARVLRSKNEITGDYITYDMKRELAQVTGNTPGHENAKGGRVKAVIEPPPAKKEPPGKAAEPAPTLELKPDEGKS